MNGQDPVLNVPSDQTVHELIKAKAFESPKQKAATFCGTSWTYEELNSRANTVASRLISNGIKRGDRVGILTRPSLDMTANSSLGFSRQERHSFQLMGLSRPAYCLYAGRLRGRDSFIQKDSLHQLPSQVMSY
ncbi:AMP-binding protein [Bacillus sp. SL00103]